MLYTPHFLTGVAIMKYIPNPVKGLPVAFLSHIVLDLIPHTDFDITPGMNIKDILFENKKRRNILLASMGIDFVLLLISLFWVFLSFDSSLMLIIGGVVAILPDVIEQGFLLLGKPLTAIQDRFQNRVCLKYGLISYPIVSIIALILLIS